MNNNMLSAGDRAFLKSFGMNEATLRELGMSIGDLRASMAQQMQYDESREQEELEDSLYELEYNSPPREISHNDPQISGVAERDLFNTPPIAANEMEEFDMGLYNDFEVIFIISLLFVARSPEKI